MRDTITRFGILKTHVIALGLHNSWGSDQFLEYRNVFDGGLKESTGVVYSNVQLHCSPKLLYMQ